MFEMVSVRFGVLFLVVLAACASGKQETLDGAAGVPDGVKRSDLIGDGTVDRAAQPDQAGTVDQDGDGHCKKGVPDPGGLCQSHDDCDDTDKTRHPGAVEDCANAGVDNDCDGDAAEVEGHGDPCATGLPGVCDAGTQECQGTSLACAPLVQVGQLAELCNGKDDDCDGETDEGSNLCPAGQSCQSGACKSQCKSGNLAKTATASSSGGGAVAGYDAAELVNDLLQASCQFHWIYAGDDPAKSTSWIQLTWSAPVTLNEVWIDTAPASTGACGMSAGRTLAGGSIQAFTNNQWVDLAAVVGKNDDWTHSFKTVTTTKLRIYGVHAPKIGLGKNPMVFEWRVHCK
jgi:hypothetical protein